MEAASPRSSLILMGIAAVVLAGLWLWKERVDEERPTLAASSQPTSDSLRAAPREAPPGPGHVTAPTRRTWGTAEGRRRRAAMLAEIRRRLERGRGEARSEEPAEEAEPPPAGRRPVPPLGRDYIQEVVADDLLPLARECYNQVLEENPDFEGQTVITFTVVGDPEVGGVVEEATEVPEQSTLPPLMAECMVESVKSLTFDPPEEGGRVVVTYPFRFALESSVGGGARRGGRAPERASSEARETQ